MKVFVNRINYEYADGVILVAANSEEEADQLYFEKCKTDGDTCTEEDFDNAPDRFKWDRRWVQYPIDGWYEHPTLSANVNTPQIIMEVSYEG